MSVEREIGEVKLPAREPFVDERVVSPCEDLVPRFEPVELFCDASPLGLGVLYAGTMKLLVGVYVYAPVYPVFELYALFEGERLAQYFGLTHPCFTLPFGHQKLLRFFCLGD